MSDHDSPGVTPLTSPHTTPSGIAFHNASVVVDADEGQRTILKPFSLTLAESRIGVIGANGSGKSTLIRLINGLRSPSSGRVIVNGRDVSRETAAVRREVGFVFTDPDAQLVMPTPIEDVALSLRRLPQGSPSEEPGDTLLSGLGKGVEKRPHRGTRHGSEFLAAAAEVLSQFGLTDHAHASVHTLSGGQKQLLALAGVLATRPRILVCDEPTTLLDLANSLLIAERLLSVDAQLVVATHDLDLAARMDRVLVIANGSIVFDGDAASAIDHYRGLAHTGLGR